LPTTAAQIRRVMWTLRPCRSRPGWEGSDRSSSRSSARTRWPRGLASGPSHNWCSTRGPIRASNRCRRPAAAELSPSRTPAFSRSSSRSCPYMKVLPLEIWKVFTYTRKLGKRSRLVDDAQGLVGVLAPPVGGLGDRGTLLAGLQLDFDAPPAIRIDGHGLAR